MKLKRIQNTRKNITAGAAQKLICMCFPFIFRTVMISKMGVEYLGLSSLFTSILNVLNLVELGAEGAIVYAMYEPIATDDSKTLCAIMEFTRKVYMVIGIAVILIGLILSRFLPWLISGSIPGGLNLYIMFFISVSSVSLQYLTGYYKQTLLVAFQRNDMRSWINTFKVFFRYLLQIVVIILWKNYYVFLLVQVLMTVLSNLLTSICVDKLYPELKACGKLTEKEYKSVLNNIKCMFLYKIGDILSNSVDNIVISAVLGLTVLTRFDNYFYIITVLIGFLHLYFDSIRAVVGNKLALEGKAGGLVLFKQLSTVQGWIVGWMSICLVCLYQDFMMFWMKDTSLLLDNTMVVLFGVYLYTRSITEIVGLFKGAAALWEYDRLCPLISAVCNLIINIILVNIIGLYGIVLSTIFCSMTFTLLWSCRGFFRSLFNEGYREYLLLLAKNTVFTVLTGVGTYFLCSMVHAESAILRFILKGFICASLPNVLYYVWLRKNPAIESVLLLISGDLSQALKKGKRKKWRT